jgi:hypothetical protein
MSEFEEALEKAKTAFHQNDPAALAELLQRYPGLKEHINDPVLAFDSPPIISVQSREMLDVLLDAGADINAKSRWWAGGFGLLHCASPELAAYAVQRGATIDVHAAARMGMLDQLRELVRATPELVHAKGGDGQTPLHFAKTVEIARFLLDHGAEMDARDIDHESTPAQYMVRDRSDVARFLVTNGCETDVLLATALGDADLVRKHVAADPGCLRLCACERCFPKRNPRAGGTIYIWTLGHYKTAHRLAREFGHDELFQFLMERSPDELRLAVACELGDEAMVQGLMRSRPGLIASLTEFELRKLPNAAEANNTRAVKLMTAAGWPVDVRARHGATPLHWAGFHGNEEMAGILLKHSPPLELRDTDFDGTPLGWAIHGSEHGWFSSTGNYAATVKGLLDAGAKAPAEIAGSAPVREVLRRHEMGA